MRRAMVEPGEHDRIAPSSSRDGRVRESVSCGGQDRPDYSDAPIPLKPAAT